MLHDLMAVTGIRFPLVGLFMIDITGIHVTKKNMTKWKALFIYLVGSEQINWCRRTLMKAKQIPNEVPTRQMQGYVARRN